MKLSSIIATLFLTLGANAIPESFDWRQQGIMTPVKHQMNCGSQYAFASAGVMEAYLKWKTGMEIDISEQAIVDCSYRKYMGGQHNGGCEGGWPTAVFQYFNDYGIIMEHQYRYYSGQTQRHGQCQFPYPVNDGVRGKLKIQHVMPQTEDQLADILVNKGPIVIAMAADNEYQRFFDGLGDGVFDMNHAIGLQPNHAVVLVGYGTQNGKRYWLIKNSWGAQWAMGGYGKIVRGKNMCGIMNYGVFYVEGL